MPIFVSGPELTAAEYIAGGLYFFVIARLRLTLDDDGTATLVRELVLDSWYDRDGFDDGGLWSGTHDRGCITWTNSRHGEAVAWIKRTADDAWLIVSEWEGPGAPNARAFQRLAPDLLT